MIYPNNNHLPVFPVHRECDGSPIWIGSLAFTCMYILILVRVLAASIARLLFAPPSLTHLKLFPLATIHDQEAKFLKGTTGWTETEHNGVSEAEHLRK
jgi:hypothetical protein